MASKKNNDSLSKNNAKGHHDNHNGNASLPKMYSTIEEINRHLNLRHLNNTDYSTISTPAAQDNCNTRNSNTIHEKKNKLTPPHLFLHFDVNETILLGDPAGGDSVHECVNKIIAKSAFVSTSGIQNHLDDGKSDDILVEGDPTTQQQQQRIKRSPSSGNMCDTHQFEPTHWWNGVSINNDDGSTPPPPLYTGWTYPPNTCPYYRTRYKVHAKKFTSSVHWRMYRPLYDQLCLKMGLDCVHDGSVEVSDVQQQTTSVFQNFLPAFWHTLMYYFPSTTKTEVLTDESDSSTAGSIEVRAEHRRLLPPPKVTLVLRTFGLDLPRVQQPYQNLPKGIIQITLLTAMRI